MTYHELELARARYKVRDFRNDCAMWEAEVKRLTAMVAAEKLASAKRSSLAAFI